MKIVEVRKLSTTELATESTKLEKKLPSSSAVSILGKSKMFA